MTDRIPATISFDRRFMRKGKHSIMLFLPEPYHASIGLIIAYWGNFEVAFNACLGGLISGEASSGGSRDTTGWEVWNFKARRALFKKICNEWLAIREPEESDILIKISDRAGDLSWKRNIIAHGNYTYTILSNSSDAVNCRAIDHSRGREFGFDEKILKKLYHDISHLTADLLFSFQRFGRVEGQFTAIPDAEILRIFRETVHPWNPNPNLRPPVPNP